MPRSPRKVAIAVGIMVPNSQRKCRTALIKHFWIRDSVDMHTRNSLQPIDQTRDQSRFISDGRCVSCRECFAPGFHRGIAVAAEFRQDNPPRRQCPRLIREPVFQFPSARVPVLLRAELCKGAGAADVHACHTACPCAGQKICKESKPGNRNRCALTSIKPWGPKCTASM